MNHLKPWLDETSDADEFERSILRAGLGVDPTQSTQEQIWSSLVSALPVAPLVGLAAASPAIGAKSAAVGVGKAGTVLLAVAKGFVVGLAVYGATAGMSELAHRPSSSSVPTVAVPRVTHPGRATATGAERSTANLAPVIEDARAKTPTTLQSTTSTPTRQPLKREPELPSVASFADPEQPSRQTSLLDAETHALRRAHDELRSGMLADARATLEASQRRFAAPELLQEREALMIELLYRSGRMTEAAQRAQVFLSRFPDSPHAQQVRLFAGR